MRHCLFSPVTRNFLNYYDFSNIVEWLDNCIGQSPQDSWMHLIGTHRLMDCHEHDLHFLQEGHCSTSPHLLTHQLERCVRNVFFTSKCASEDWGQKKKKVWVLKPSLCWRLPACQCCSLEWERRGFPYWNFFLLLDILVAFLVLFISWKVQFQLGLGLSQSLHSLAAYLYSSQSTWPVSTCSLEELSICQLFPKADYLFEYWQEN